MQSLSQQAADGVDPRLQKFETQAKSVVLTHESVSPGFIVMWMTVQLMRAEDYHKCHGDGQVEVEFWTRTIEGMKEIYPL